MSAKRTTRNLQQELDTLRGRIADLESRLSPDTEGPADRTAISSLSRAPAMLHSIDREARLLDVSDQWLEVLGYERGEVIGRKVTDFLTEDAKRLAESTIIPKLIQTGVVQDITYQFVKKNGETIDVLLSAVAEYDAQLQYLRCVAVVTDVSSLKRTEEALRQAHSQVEKRIEERTGELQESIAKLQKEVAERRRVEEMLEKQRRFLRQVVDVDPNFIFAKDRQGHFTLVNQAVADAYGTTVEALIGKTDADFNPNAEEVRFFRQVDLEVMDTLEQRFIAEEAITDSTGRVRWLQTVKRPLVGEDGTAQQVLGSATDITTRRQAEEDLRRSEAALRQSQKDLRLLAAKLLTGQEEERRRLAREMHDDVSQRLAALAIETGRLEQAVEGENEHLQVGLQALSRQVIDLSNDVHDISHQLHPSILEDLGLEDALASECKGFTRREHIQVQFHADRVPSTLPPDLALCLYRITQEGLRNIAKHAKTDHARVSLAGNGTMLTLTIEDDGCGFDRAEVTGHRGLGLASMAERARMIQAELEVESQPDQGTRIRVSTPVGSVSALEPAGR